VASWEIVIHSKRQKTKHHLESLNMGKEDKV
jgi:hypothetical protein